MKEGASMLATLLLVMPTFVGPPCVSPMIDTIQDFDESEANIMAIAQKPFHGSIFTAKSGSPAWKQLPTWYQISTSDLMIPPDVQQKFAKQMNATTISIDASHASYVSHPDEIAKLILDAAKAKNTQ